MTWATVAKLCSAFWFLGMGAAFATHNTPDHSMLEFFWGLTATILLLMAVCILPIWKIVSEAE